MPAIKIENIDGGIVFLAKIVPASSKTQISGVLDEMLKVKVSAAPEKGKANKCLITFLAKKLGLKKKDIEIISGQTNPVKKVQVIGIGSKEFLRKLGLDSE
ncbi:MAG: DUF167 domain-containing protein [Phycisphaerae bacterium]|nr:DUF167 domain-containing protein [Phycisphaerae bacterium]